MREVWDKIKWPLAALGLCLMTLAFLSIVIFLLILLEVE